MDLNAIASVVVNTALAIHKQFGPGLLESAYEALMLHMLEQHGLEVRRQVPIPLIFNGVELGENTKIFLFFVFFVPFVRDYLALIYPKTIKL